MNALFTRRSRLFRHSAHTVESSTGSRNPWSQPMLKKTLLATAAISATLFAVAAVLPALAQSRSGATSFAPTSAAQALPSAPLQDKRQAADDGRTGKAEHRRDRQQFEGNGREGRAAAAKGGAGTDGSVASTDKAAKADMRGDDRHGSEGKKDQERSRD
ncbi:MAG TPA: hypothetical protein VET87_03965 [Rubrivivax sp.]|nr:hypothetical protein [Rubrivivax sp.]